MTSTYSVLRFQCAVCFKNYETRWNPAEEVNLQFLCECGTPLTVRTLKAEPDEPTTNDHKQIV